MPLDRSLKYPLDDRHELPDRRIADTRGGKVSAESSEYLRSQVSKPVAAKPRQYISVPEVGVDPSGSWVQGSGRRKAPTTLLQSPRGFPCPRPCSPVRRYAGVCGPRHRTPQRHVLSRGPWSARGRVRHAIGLAKRRHLDDAPSRRSTQVPQPRSLRSPFDAGKGEAPPGVTRTLTGSTRFAATHASKSSQPAPA
jgi:hypothetical protein